MSSSSKSGGYNPVPRLSLKELQAFKDLFAEHPSIKWSIIAAGIGGALEGFHILWLLLIWVCGRLPR